jgi:hypothetical protein
MLFKEQPLISAKKEFKYIFKYLNDSNDIVLFRVLRWDEYKVFRELLTTIPKLTASIKDHIFFQCLIDTNIPSIDNLDFVPSGIIETISNFILNISGPDFGDKIFNDLDQVRDYEFMNSESRLFSLMSYFFGTQEKDFEGMYWSDILKLLAQLELIMSKTIPDVPFRIEENQNVSHINTSEENKQINNV